VKKGALRGTGRRTGGFTLAEVAVTIALVGLALAWMLQVLNAAKLNALQSRNLKLSRELALLTVGQIQGGLFADELDDDRIEGSYAEEGYPDFSFEAIIGDENFRPDENDRAAFDNWRHERDQKERERGEEDDEAAQPYEKIQVKVVSPKIQDQPNEYVLELWVPWEQIHPPAEGTEEGAEKGASGGSNSSSSGGNGSKR
jgi:prepilin-type N-terminal cleavage/methylation domain-containing protein